MAIPRITPEAAYHWKVRLFFAGAFFVVLGIFLNRRILVAAAVVPLGIAFALRFVDRKPRHTEVHPSWYDDEDEKP